MINPKRQNENYLIYTIEEGGEYLVFSGWSKEGFRLLEERGWFEVRLGDYIRRIYPTFATLVKGIDNQDFRIDEINGIRKEPKKRVKNFYRRTK